VVSQAGGKEGRGTGLKPTIIYPVIRLFPPALLVLPALTAHAAPPEAKKTNSENFHKFAITPPMGWNSWDCFGTAVTEAQVRDNAAYIAKHLLKHGWNLVTIDIDWFMPNASGFDYQPNAPIELNRFGIVQPAPNRFPSSQGGLGFKPLADDFHRKGMKLGLHLLRGIPRKAVADKLPIEGTNFTAADIANRKDTCPWNPDMYGVDMSKPGGQAYYDSLFRQLAKWGVDFVKVDDLSAPYHKAEIDAIRKAIDASGRAIVFSTSPGATSLEHAADIEDHANMWRISGDFWDNWNALKEQFDRLDRWTPYRGEGHWPDADMLPLGAVRQGQRDDWTHFTPIEQTTLLTLWSIARSPLILGGNLVKNDKLTESLITNDEVLAANRASLNNRQVWRRGDQIAWIADVPHSKDKYLALFNAANQKDPGAAGNDAATSPIEANLKDLGFPAGAQVRDLWAHRNLGKFIDRFSAEIPWHGAGMYRLSPR
jgi:hypothetical protein